MIENDIKVVVKWLRAGVGKAYRILLIFLSCPSIFFHFVCSLDIVMFIPHCISVTYSPQNHVVYVQKAIFI